MRLNSPSVNCPSPPVRTHALGFQSPPQNPRPIVGGFVTVHAHAKINLYLDVLERREDGYHDIVSVMQSLGLCDDLMIMVKAVVDAEAAVTLACNDPTLPTNENNLVVKAAMLLVREYSIRDPIHIELTKRIPAGAGLGGGSSDCAATLHGINKLFGLNIPMDKLMEYGKSLGADVPFCLMAGAGTCTALAEGIGEKLTPLPPHPDCYIVLVCPGIHVSTAEAYALLQSPIPVDESLKQYIAPSRVVAEGQVLADLMVALSAGDVSGIAANFFNIFTLVTATKHPEILHIIHKLQDLGALGASMSGTGSAVFAYFDNKNNAQAACNRFQNAFLTHIFNPERTDHYEKN